MLVQYDAPGDREQALTLLDDALAAAEDIGMTRLAEQALTLAGYPQGVEPAGRHRFI